MNIHRFGFIFILALGVGSHSGCTTATYGERMTPIGNDTYTMKIYVGGPMWTGESGSLPRVRQEAEEFMAQNPKYKYFEVVDSQKNFFPSYFLYTIRYFESEEKSMIFQRENKK